MTIRILLATTAIAVLGMASAALAAEYNNGYTTSTSSDATMLPPTTSSQITPYAQTQTLDQQLQTRNGGTQTWQPQSPAQYQPQATMTPPMQPQPMQNAPMQPAPFAVQTPPGQPYMAPQPSAAQSAPTPMPQQESMQNDQAMADSEPGAGDHPRNDSLYISGGVSTDERQELAAIAHNYNLKVQMSTSTGEFMSDVDVKVTSAKGKLVFETQTDGPLLMAKLDPGKYKIEETKYGTTKTQTVDVGKGMKSLSVVWQHDA